MGGVGRTLAHAGGALGCERPSSSTQGAQGTRKPSLSRPDTGNPLRARRARHPLRRQHWMRCLGRVKQVGRCMCRTPWRSAQRCGKAAVQRRTAWPTTAACRKGHHVGEVCAYAKLARMVEALTLGGRQQRSGHAQRGRRGPPCRPSQRRGSACGSGGVLQPQASARLRLRAPPVRLAKGGSGLGPPMANAGQPTEAPASPSTSCPHSSAGSYTGQCWDGLAHAPCGPMHAPSGTLRR